MDEGYFILGVLAVSPLLGGLLTLVIEYCIYKYVEKKYEPSQDTR